MSTSPVEPAPRPAPGAEPAPAAPGAPPEAPDEHPRLLTRYGAGRIPGRFGVVVALTAGMLALVAGVLLAVLTLAFPTGTARTAATLLIQDVAFLSAVGVVALLAGPVRRRDVGLQVPPRPLLAVGLAVLAFFAYLGLAALVLELLGASDVTDTNPENLGITDGLVPALVVGGIATTLTPVAEEVIFRGLLFGGLARTIARVAPSPVAIGIAAIVVGGLFGLAHAGATTPVLLLPLTVFGVVLCVLTWATRSLLPAIGVHALNNVFAVGSAAEFSPAGIAAFAAGTFLVLALGLLALRAVGRRTGPVGTSAIGGPQLARL